MGLLGTLTTSTPGWLMSLYMLVLGAGLGLVMQVLVLAVQNAVPRSELGVATSASTFFRSMGGSFGTAVFGAILAGRLAANLPQNVPGTEGGTPNPATLATLPEPAQHAVIGAFVEATNTVFLIAAAVMAAAFVLTWFLKEIRLRDDAHPHLEEAGAAPVDRDEIVESAHR
jgi:MFS family permease